MTDHQNHQNHQTALDEDAELEALFGAARQSARERPQVLPDRLFDAIVADAAAVQAESAQAEVRRVERAANATEMPQGARGPWAAMIAALGGWGTVSGLVAASCTGLWIGFSAPEALLSTPGLSTLTAVQLDGDYTSYETFDLASVLVEDMQ